MMINKHKHFRRIDTMSYVKYFLYTIKRGERNPIMIISSFRSNENSDKGNCKDLV